MSKGISDQEVVHLNEKRKIIMFSGQTSKGKKVVEADPSTSTSLGEL